MKKACCGFGHRVVWADIHSSLDDEVERAIAEGCHVFYTGAQGDFDRLFTEAVQKAKRKHKDISLICVCPYYTKQIQKIENIMKIILMRYLSPWRLMMYTTRWQFQSAMNGWLIIVIWCWVIRFGNPQVHMWQLNIQKGKASWLEK